MLSMALQSDPGFIEFSNNHHFNPANGNDGHGITSGEQVMLSLFQRMVERPHIAVDLGNATTRVYSCELGMVAEEPSLVQMIPQSTKAQNLDVLITYLNTRFVSHPLRGGVIVNAKAAVSLLKPLFKRARKTLRSPISLVCAPTDATETERRLLAQTVVHAGASRVAILPEPMAAAIGAGIDTSQPYSQLLIDIGDGVTDLAVIRAGVLIFTSALRIACSDLHKAVQHAILSGHRVCLYPGETEKLIRDIDLAPHIPDRAGSPKSVKGIDIAKRSDVRIEVTNQETRAAIEPIISRILKMIQTALRHLPEEISAEVMESGICLTGGGSYVPGMDRLIALKTGLDTRVAADPMHAVIHGAIETLEFWKEKQSWWENLVWPVSTTENRRNIYSGQNVVRPASP